MGPQPWPAYSTSFPAPGEPDCNQYKQNALDYQNQVCSSDQEFPWRVKSGQRTTALALYSITVPNDTDLYPYINDSNASYLQSWQLQHPDRQLSEFCPANKKSMAYCVQSISLAVYQTENRQKIAGLLLRQVLWWGKLHCGCSHNHVWFSVFRIE